MKSNEKFTVRAELAIERAREAAGALGHSHVGTEHLLLGILSEGEGLGSRILLQHGLDEARLRRELSARLGQGAACTPSTLPARSASGAATPWRPKAARWSATTATRL